MKFLIKKHWEGIMLGGLLFRIDHVPSSTERETFHQGKKELIGFIIHLPLRKAYQYRHPFYYEKTLNIREKPFGVMIYPFVPFSMLTLGGINLLFTSTGTISESGFCIFKIVYFLSSIQ